MGAPADDRSIRFELGLRCGEQSGERPQEDELRSSTLSRYAHVHSGRVLRRRHGPGKKTVGAIYARWREDAGSSAIKQGLDLVSRPAYRRGRSDDLRPHDSLARSTRRQLINRRLVKSRDRSERTGNEVQLVLNDEVGRVERPAVSERPPFAWLSRAVETDAILEAVDMAKEGTSLADPGQCRELVHRRDQECRQASINRLVHREDWKRPIPAEVAIYIGATNLEVGRHVLVGHAGEGRSRELRAAPWTCLQRRRGSLVATVPETPHATDRGGFVRLATASKPIGRCIRTDPQADLDRPIAEQATALLVSMSGIGPHQIRGRTRRRQHELTDQG